MPLKNTDKLKKALLEKGLITKSNLDIAEKKSKEKAFEDVLLDENLIDQEQLGTVISELYNLPYIRLSSIITNEEVITEIPYGVARSQNVIAFDKDEESIKIAVSDPENKEIIKFISQKTGKNIKTFYAPQSEIKNKLRAYNQDLHKRFDTLIKEVQKNSEKCSQLVDSIFALAYEKKASDIHIEPHNKSVLIRFRVDGTLQDIINLPNEIRDIVTARIKVMSLLKTDEHRLPQDGRIKTFIDGEEVTMRVSTVPIYDGEKIVLRLLASENKTLTLKQLGYNQKNYLKIADAIRKPHGMILVTGPTGSGKTTTLYAILKEVNSRDVNISTIEDPIEYKLESINQIQVNPLIGLTFAAGLRSLLRQDPNIIMVGEIRDKETAEIAVNAALTGHLVLATLHTNNASSTLIRLIEMGIDPLLVGSTVIIAVAQRLARKICQNCKKQYEFTAVEMSKLCESLKLPMSVVEQLNNASKKEAHENKIYFYRGEGCQLCTNLGSQGRTCIAEVITVDEQIRKLIMKNGSPDEIKAKALTLGMEDMFVNGIQKALNGETTIEEVFRVTRE